MNNTNFPTKRKTVTEKDILDFFSIVEEKLEGSTQNLESFIGIFTKFSNLNEEEILSKLQEVLSVNPMLILELNKLLPKSSRLPLVVQENADNFLLKIKNRDENIFREVMKVLFSLKNNEMNLDKIILKFEELLSRHPDLLEEAYMFLDYKRINTSLYKKTFPVNRLQSKNEQRQKALDSRGGAAFNSSSYYTHSLMHTPTKISNPEFVFFTKMKTIFPQKTYKVTMKLLHLYNEGVLNHSEFIEMVQPYFSSFEDLFEYLKTLTYSKIMNRRHYSIINKPLNELDLSKSQRICTSYLELPKNYPKLICSGRTEEIANMLNDRFISIPTGSEDDKNPSRKNHYEENIFKFEDQRYELDMIIEILKFAIEGLERLNEECNASNGTNIQPELSKSIVKFISRLYKEYGQQVLQGILHHPKDTIPIVVNRFRKRMEETVNQKAELEKSIKVSFDRFYLKSFDYRMVRYKNFDKKNNNAKAFVKEILQRKKEKMCSSNSNFLKGGLDGAEFFTSLNIRPKPNQELIGTLDIEDILSMNMKHKLPDLRVIFDNLDIFRLTLSLIWYQLYSGFNTTEVHKISDTLSSVVQNLLGFNLTEMTSKFNTGDFSHDRNLNYSEVVDGIRKVDEEQIEKFYNFNTILSTIKREENFDFVTSNLREVDNNSEISLTPSLQSQETGKTYKEATIQDEKSEEEGKFLFFPQKTHAQDVLFYSNENWYIVLRYIFCIYERLNKLNETAGNLLKHFIIIYKAFLHKKVENSTSYEEICRDLFGNESFYLFNLDKIVNSLIKTVSTINNDTMSKECLSLFLSEKERKLAPNEFVYFSNFLQLIESPSTNLRVLANKKSLTVTFHVVDLPSGVNKKDYYESFKEFIEGCLQESYSQLFNENFDQDDPFNVFLCRNMNMIKQERKNTPPLYYDNSLCFRFDYASKKMKFLNTKGDVLICKSHKPPGVREKLKLEIKKSLDLKLWIESKI